MLGEAKTTIMKVSQCVITLSETASDGNAESTNRLQTLTGDYVEDIVQYDGCMFV